MVTECHLPALRRLGLAAYATVVDLSSATLKTLRRKFPEVKIRRGDFGRLSKEFLLGGLFDAVVVALPNWFHEEAVLGALENGFHVLCEKPLALTQQACLKMADCAQRVQRVLMVNMVRRRLPSMVALAEAFREDLLGDLVRIDVEDGEPFAWLSDSGAFFKKESGGVLADMGVHYLDLMEMLVGKLSPVSYQDDFQGGVEANALFRLTTSQGIPVRMKLSRAYQLDNRVVFQGSRGALVVEKNDFEGCWWRPKGSSTRRRLSAKNPFSMKGWSPTLESSFAQQWLDFSRCVQEGKSPPTTATQAASTVSLIEWAYRRRETTNLPGGSNRISGSPPLPRASVFVTGGTGFIGSQLIRRLFELGFDRLAVAVRNHRSCAEIARFPVKLLKVDLLSRRELESAMKGARWVFHCAYGRDGLFPSRITIQGTRNVVEAAIAVGCECVVVLSTAAVLGYPKDTTVDETYPYHPVLGEYGKSKMQMERWCLRRALTSGSTRIVVLNPSCVYGPGGKTYTATPLQMARDGSFCWIEGGRGIANYTYVDNVVWAMLKAASCRQAHGQRFIINDGHTTWRAFLTPFLGPWTNRTPAYSNQELSDLRKRAPRSPRLTRLKGTLPAQMIREAVEKVAPDLLRRLRQWQRSVSGPQLTSPLGSNVPPVWLADLFGTTSTIFSSDKARRILQWEPTISLEQGQELTVAWLRECNLL